MEGLGFCLFGCVFVIVAIFLLAFGSSLIATIVGLIGSVAFDKNWKFTRVSAGLSLAGIFIILLIVGGSWLVQKAFTQPNYRITDEELKPFRSAIDEVDRASLGFTPISPNARIEIEYTDGTESYDVMLHIYADTSRTIAFKKVGNTYKWIGEQEIHRGPHLYRTIDGSSNEEIVITYDTMHISGFPDNEVSIRYEGEDIRLNSKRRNLTLQDVQPILAEWQAVRPTPTPW